MHTFWRRAESFVIVRLFLVVAFIYLLGLAHNLFFNLCLLNFWGLWYQKPTCEAEPGLGTIIICILLFG